MLSRQLAGQLPCGSSAAVTHRRALPAPGCFQLPARTQPRRLVSMKQYVQAWLSCVAACSQLALGEQNCRRSI